MTHVHLVLPAGYDDPHRPSGGNHYDRSLRAGLAGLGWTVVVHEAPDASARPREATAAAVERQLALIPAGRIVIVDGLVGAAAETALLRHSTRLRLVALVHMPGPPGGPSAAVLRAARLVVTTSHFTAQSLREQRGVPGSLLLVAPPGAFRADLAAGTRDGGALLCVAAVTHLKGHDLLFAALARLSGLAWSCLCVGALDNDLEFVRRQRRTLEEGGIADRVQLTGPLAGAALGRAYAAADVLVLPTRLESYGMVVTEALARGLPVIATSVGGVPQALGHAADGRLPGILVRPDDDRGLSHAIADWLGQPSCRAELRSAARSRRSLLGSWEQTVTSIARALDRLAAA